MNVFRNLARIGKTVILVIVLTSLLFPGVDPTVAAGGLQVFLPVIMNGAPYNNEPYVIYSLSDSYIQLTTQQAFQQMQNNAFMVCITPAAPERITLTLDQAKQNAWGFLVDQVGQSNLDGFRAAPEVSTADKLQVFAAAAMADGEPEGALAAFLIANEKDPSSPMILINAAGMLSSFGMYNEALAFLDAAQAQGDPLDAPLGIPGKFYALNNRGRAMIGLGLYSQAEPLLRQVTSNATELSEGRLNLAWALLCQSTKPYQITDPLVIEAVDWYRKSDDRFEGGYPIYDPLTGWPIDLAGGQAFTLRDLVVPTSASYAEAFGQKARQLSDEAFARDVKIRDQINAIQAQRDSGPPVSLITSIRFSKILFESNYTWTLPEMLALDPLGVWDPNFFSNLATAFYNWEQAHWGDPNWSSDCQSIVQQQWMQLKAPLHAYYIAYNKYAQVMYYRQTALAANLLDPLNHEEASLTAEWHAESNLAYFMRDYQDFTDIIANEWHTCQALASTPVDGFQPPSYDRSNLCPSNLRGVKLSLKLDDMAKISVNCEIVQLEGSTPGLLGFFVQWTYDNRGTKTTIFVGAKQGFDVGVAGISAKEGFFVTGNRDGISDVGVKISSGGSLGYGGISGTIEGPGVTVGVADSVGKLILP